MKLGIKTKLITITLSLIIISSLIVGLVSYRVARDELKEAGKEKLKNAANSALEMSKMIKLEADKGNLSTAQAQEKIKEVLLGQKQNDGTRSIDSKINLGEYGYFFIYNSSGDVVAHPYLEGENVWEEKSGNDFYFVQDQIKKALEANGGFTRYNWDLPDQNKPGEKITYSLYFPDWDWIIVASTYMRDFEQGIDNILSILKWTLLITIIVSFLLVFILTNRISRGIKNVVDYANKLARGKLNVPDLDIEHSDEVGILVSSINNMKKKLRKSYKQLKDYNKEIENQKTELQASYEQLEANNEEIEALNEELEESIKESELLNENLEKVIEVTQDLSKFKLEDQQEYLKKIFKTAYDLVTKADFGSVYIYINENVKFLETIGYDLAILNEVKLDKSILTNKNAINEIKFVENTDMAIINLLNKQRTKSMFKKAVKPVKQSLNFNIAIDNEVIGGISLDIAKNSNTEFSDEDTYTLRSFKSLTESFYMIHNYYSLQKEFVSEIVLAITKLLEIHDEYTNGHSQHVAEIAASIAKEMGLSQNKINKIYWAGLVHDLGKIVISDKILNKKGSLDDSEYEKIKKHPVWGYQTLNKSERLSDISEYVKYHHERWDGNGYPEGLKADNIPLGSRILGVADAWDAMTSDRSYRKALSREKAIKELKDNSRTQFDKEIVQVFLKVINDKEDIDSNL